MRIWDDIWQPPAYGYSTGGMGEQYLDTVTVTVNISPTPATITTETFTSDSLADVKPYTPDIGLKDAVLFIIEENGLTYSVKSGIIKVFKPEPLPLMNMI